MLKLNAVFPGTFNPIHPGHINIIKRASKLFHHLYVAVSINIDKKNCYTLSSRFDKTKKTVDKLKLKNVTVIKNTQLTIDLLKKLNCKYIVRSIRDENDAKYEIKMAQNNYFLNKNIETIFFVADSKLTNISSSNIRLLKKYKQVLKTIPHE